jgi:hypothetical protein
VCGACGVVVVTVTDDGALIEIRTPLIKIITIYQIYLEKAPSTTTPFFFLMVAFRLAVPVMMRSEIRKELRDKRKGAKNVVVEI